MWNTPTINVLFYILHSMQSVSFEKLRKSVKIGIIGVLTLKF